MFETLLAKQHVYVIDFDLYICVADFLFMKNKHEIKSYRSFQLMLSSCKWERERWR